MNKVVRINEQGIELEADPRHAELVVKELGLESAKASTTPGSKTEAKGKTTDDDATTMTRSKATKARIEVEESVSAVEEARGSAKGEVWKAEAGEIIEIARDDDEG